MKAAGILKTAKFGEVLKKERGQMVSVFSAEGRQIWPCDHNASSGHNRAVQWFLH